MCVEPLIKDTLTSEQRTNQKYPNDNLSTKDKMLGPKPVHYSGFHCNSNPCYFQTQGKAYTKFEPRGPQLSKKCTRFQRFQLWIIVNVLWISLFLQCALFGVEIFYTVVLRDFSRDFKDFKVRCTVADPSVQAHHHLEWEEIQDSLPWVHATQDSARRDSHGNRHGTIMWIQDDLVYCLSWNTHLFIYSAELC